MSAYNFSPQVTPFVGRLQELAEIAALVSNPACRLLTLVGTGGIGKTRLGLEVAKQTTPNFEPDSSHMQAVPGINLFQDGVYFIDLQSLNASDHIVTTIANTIHDRFFPGNDPQQQLIDYLSHKSLLLILDNLEHLVGCAAIISAILEGAPQVKIMTTTREILNLREEWLYPIIGMPFPEQENNVDIDEYPAGELFIQCARRLKPDFSIEAERAGIYRICVLSEGMPLALELAASWVRVLACDEIASEIQQSLNFLDQSLRNFPPRHRNIHAVMDHSWQLLSQPERDVFKKLSIFRGGFTREAAESVAGATLHILSALVDKSLIRMRSAARYDLHEFLRKYGEEKLYEVPPEAVCIQHLHSAFYAEFMSQCRFDLLGNRQKEGLKKIEVEIENVQDAFCWSVDQRNLDNIEKSFESLWHFYEIRCWNHKGVEVFRKAVDAIEQVINHADKADENQQRLLGFVLTGYARCLQQAFGSPETKSLFEKALAILRGISLNREMVYTLNILVQYTDNYAEAEKLTYEAMAIARQFDFKLWVAQGLGNLSGHAFRHGDYARGRQLAEEVILLSHEINNGYGEVGGLVTLSLIACAEENYQEANRLAQQALGIAQALDEQTAFAAIYHALGKIAYHQRDFRGAIANYQNSVNVAQRISSRGEIAAALGCLGSAYCKLTDNGESRKCFHEALSIANELRNIPLLLNLFAQITELLFQVGQYEIGFELCNFVYNHPLGDQQAKQQVVSLRPAFEAKLLKRWLATMSRMTNPSDPYFVAWKVMNELDAPTFATEITVSEITLTDREREILKLMADGYCNHEIASDLVVAIGTIAKHSHNIFQKLGVRKRSQAIQVAYKLRLI